MSVSSVEQTTGPPPPGGPRGPARTGSSGGRGRHRPRLGPVRRIIREVGLALITAGVVVLLFVGYQLFGTGVAEANSQSQLKQQFNHLVAPSTVPSTPTTAAAATTTPPPTAPAPTAPTGEAVAHLVIPKVGIDKFIVEGVTVPQLRKGPGHYPQTPMPGQPGNAAIAGHRTTYGAPFYRLNELQPGDDIFVTTSQGKFHYTVIENEVVKPTEVSVLDPTTDARLTLTTCNPRYSASQRLVVISRLVTPPAPIVQGQASAGAVLNQQALTLGSGDTTAWPPTLLFGALAVLLWTGVRVAGASARRVRWLPFVLGIPLCLVPLWFLFENAIRLLPANI